MKTRPTIALCAILKNEAHNIGPFLESNAGCFDAMYFTDTGSTDNSVEILTSKRAEEIAGCPIHVSHFDWIKDFSAARQFNFDQVPDEIDYIAWEDLDDCLGNKESFIHWRDHTMHTAHQWLVNYNYAYENGEPVCTFYRERVVKNNHGFKWQYFLHEGLVQKSNKKTDSNFASCFTINHMRTDSDVKADRSRNLQIFEYHIENGYQLEPRMIYYYGKELFDSGHYLKSLEYLQRACELSVDSGLELHDRIMAQQFLSMAYGKCGKWEQALGVALNGLHLAPDRSEFFVCVGDALIQLGKTNEAKVYYECAKHCGSGNAGGAIYSSPIAKKSYPCHQLAQIYLSQLDWRNAQIEVDQLKSSGHPSVPAFQRQIDDMKQKDVFPSIKELIPTEDIVISTPPGSIIKDWDENVLATKGLGGSETACVEIARALKKRTGRPVKVFMPRSTADVMPSGVEYLPLSHLEGYFRRYLPFKHIAWRHAHKLTPADSFCWSHDILTRNANLQENYTKLWCLTEFHKHFVMDMMGVHPEKIDIVRNGIDPELFRSVEATRNPFKVIFSSSPDRGWERCIEICKIARKEIPELELHLFYGTANLRKMGMTDEADRLDALRQGHDFVHYHGFVSKTDLVRHFKESACWLYPADFIETSCITAMESVCAGAYSLVRNIGALPDTLSDAHEKGFCTILDEDPCCEEAYEIWAKELVDILRNRKWEKIEPNLDYYSWETRLEDYLRSMDL